MSTISTAIELNDRMSSTLMVINSNIDQVCDSIYDVGGAYDEIPGVQMLNTIISTLQSINNHVQGIAGSVTDVTSNTSQALTKMDRIESAVREASEAHETYNEQIKQGTNNYDGMLGKITSIASKVATVFAVDKILDWSDEVVTTASRIDMIRDSSETLEELQDKIYASAERSRASYTDTAEAVARLANNAGNAFQSNDEIIAFLEAVNKQFVIGGADASTMTGAMTQLTQAMAAGALRGDELNSILEGAPGIARAIEESMGWAGGSIKSYAEEGLVTAEVVKNAMLSSVDDINAKFDTMPMTFAQIKTSMMNNAVDAFTPLLTRINATLNSDSFQQAANGLMTSLTSVANVALSVFDTLITAGAFVYDNWSMIAPIFFGVAAALAAYNIALGVHNTIQTISNTIKTIATIRAVAHGAATAAEAAATTGMTASQVAFNAALYACPLTWILVLIIAVIAAIYAVVAVINHVTGSTISATGVICGAVMWLLALIVNVVIGTINALIQSFWSMFVEPFIGIIEWILNACNGGFDSFGDAVANLIGQVISWFLSLGKVVTKIIDAIFGTDWTSGLNSLQDSVLSWGKSDDAITISRDAPEINYRMDMTDAYDSGYSFGEGIDDTIGGLFDTSAYESGSEDYTYDSSLYDTLASDTDEIASSTSDIADSVDISSENLKYLRDLAEQDTVNRFTTAEIKVDLTNNNNVSSGMDIDDMIVKFTSSLNEALDEVAKGVHV